MPTQTAGQTRPWLPLFIAVCLVAINMRMTISGVGPLLDEIAADQGVSPTALGLLASVPLLAWAVVSPLAHGLAARIGLDSAVSWSLVVLMTATAWRSVPGTPANLWLGTALIGATLAVTNVLMPAAIKRDFGRRVPLVMGAYSALIGLSGALGAGIVGPVAHFEREEGSALGWQWALLATGITIPIALIAWAWTTRQSSTRGAIAGVDTAATGAPDRPTASARSAQAERGTGRRVWRDPVAWQIALYMGAQSWCFYIYATWLAPIDLWRGADGVAASLNMMFFHSCGIVGSLVSPLISRGAMRRLLPLIVPLLSLVGAGGVVFVPVALSLWLFLCGLSSGAGLSISLTFIAQRSPSAAAAGAVSGMSQSFGYLIAGAGPILFGWLHGASGTWALPLLAVLTGALLQLGSGIALLRERLVFTRA